MSARVSFFLPNELCAKAPPESRGIQRDKVRLLVIDRKEYRVRHSRFDHIGEFLKEGDLLVFNSSRTLPASLQGCSEPGGSCIEARLAEHLPDDSWLALLICKQGEPFACGLRSGMEIFFEHGLTAEVLERDERIPKLWRMRFSKTGIEFTDALYMIGQPIRYEYVPTLWNLDYYQTVYATEPGSAEMPSAGRAFTWKLLFDLKKRGIDTARIVLHTGLSSYMDDELDALHPASEEEYLIGDRAAEKINNARLKGGRIIAVGTTVVRALESSIDEDGFIMPGHGYTRLRITSKHCLKAADGLLTGLHEPEASHLDLLAAFLTADKIQNAYEEAVREGYLWHEFGDVNLII